MTINDVDLIFVADLTFQETIFIGIVDTFVVLGNYSNEFFRGSWRLECSVQDASLLLGYDRLGLRVLNSPLRWVFAPTAAPLRRMAPSACTVLDRQ